MVPDEEILLHLPCDDLGFTLLFNISIKTEPVTTRSGLEALIEGVASADISRDYIMALNVSLSEGGSCWIAQTGEGVGTVEDLLAGKIETDSF